MQKWCLVNTMAPTTAWGAALCNSDGLRDPRTPQASNHSQCSILASAEPWARPHLFSAAPQGPPAICISQPLAHTSASNGSDYPAAPRALLCPCPWHMAEAGRAGLGRAGLGRQHSSHCMTAGQSLQHQLPQELREVSTAPAQPSPTLCVGMAPGCAHSPEGVGRREVLEPL